MASSKIKNANTPDFGRFHKQGPSNNVVRFKTELVSEDGSNVVFHVRFAGKGNESFTISNLRVMKSAIKNNKDLKKKFQSFDGSGNDLEAMLEITPEEMQELMATQKKQRNVYAKSVIVDWENVVVNGQAIPYSYENCVAMLEGIDAEYFEDIARFCSNRKNFDLSQNDDIDLVNDEAKTALGN